MRSWLITFPLLAVAMASSPAMAGDPLPAVPPARVTVMCNGGNPHYYEDGTVCIGGGGSAFTDVAPYPSVDVQASNPGNFSQEASMSLAAISYSWVVWAGEYRKSVPIDIDFGLEQEISNDYSGAQAFASITVFGPQGILGNGYRSICTLGCAGSGGDALEYEGTLNVLVFSGFVYTISIEATASVAASAVATEAKARADPYIYVDPSFSDAAKYSIFLSDGVGNNPVGTAVVPEPTSWMMMIVGFGLAGGVLRRRARAPSMRPA